MAIVEIKTGTVSHQGLVVALHSYHQWEATHYVAKVWNAATQKVESFDLGALRDMSDFDRMQFEAEVDAPDTVLAEIKAEDDRRYAEEQAAFSAAYAKAIIKGRTAKVVRGRKVPIGTQGTVAWVGQDNFGKGRTGLKVEGQPKLVYVATSNLEVVDVGTL